MLAERDGDLAKLQHQLAVKEKHLQMQELELKRLRVEAAGWQRLVEYRLPSTFVRTMNAAPYLAGEVTSVSGRLCTIVVGENPRSVDIQSVISRTPFRFAVYDENGYKAEVAATEYDAASQSARCSLVFAKDGVTIVVGDKAWTNP